MEKRLLLFLVLTFGIIWIYYGYIAPPPPPPKPAEKPANGAPSDDPGEKPPVVEPGEKPVEPAAGPEVPAEPTAGIPTESLSGAGETRIFDTPRIEWETDTWGGSIRTARLKKYASQPDLDLAKPESWQPVIAPIRKPASDRKKPPIDLGGRSLTLDVLSADGEVVLGLTKVLWEQVESEEHRVLFRLPIPAAGVVLEKDITFATDAEGLEGGAYHAMVLLRMRVTDLGKARKYGTDGWRIRLTGSGGLPLEVDTPSGFGTLGKVLTSDKVSPEELKPTDSGAVWPEPGEQSTERLVDWVGVQGRFFAVFLKPEIPSTVASGQALITSAKVWDEAGKEGVTGASALDFDLPYPPDGESAVSRSFLLYAGPMDPDVLEAAPYKSFESAIDYGFLGAIAKILVFLLSLFHSVLGNWGIAIILLTLCVRMAMFPLSRKQQLSMQRYSKQMSRLKPKMDAIKERHGKNKKKMNEEMMKLYREEGVRIFPAGCLLVFLQFPIFIGLFQALRYSIGLRHASFLWVKDLTSPDRLFRLGDGIPLAPEYFNLLPILMGITWWLSAYLQPKPADPQQAQTMKMMQFMPIIFSLLLYNYAAGLALYMVVSSSWSIFETKVVKKLLFKEDTAALAPATAFRKGK